MRECKIFHRFASLLPVCGGLLHADTVLVAMGDTGCVDRQQAVKNQWEKIPGVVSVAVQPRCGKDPAAQRTFVIVSRGTSPTQEILRTAFGRHDKHYPIVEYAQRAYDTGSIAAGPDRYDFGKWNDVKDVFFGRYDALVGYDSEPERSSYTA